MIRFCSTYLSGILNLVSVGSAGSTDWIARPSWNWAWGSWVQFWFSIAVVCQINTPLTFGILLFLPKPYQRQHIWSSGFYMVNLHKPKLNPYRMQNMVQVRKYGFHVYWFCEVVFFRRSGEISRRRSGPRSHPRLRRPMRDLRRRSRKVFLQCQMSWFGFVKLI